MMFKTLKKLTVAGAFAATAFVSTAQAQPVVQYSDWAFRFEGAAGYTDVGLELGLGNIIDIPINVGAGIDGFIANSAFSAAFQGPVLWMQLDGVFGLSHYHAGGASSTLKQFSGGAHFGWRDHNQGMLAANVAATGVNFGNGNTNQLRVGAVGEFYLDQFTLGAAGGFVTTLTTDTDENAYAKGFARWYVNDNLKLEGHGGAIFFDNDFEFIYGRALVEWKPDDSRVGYFARWDGFFVDESAGPLTLTVDSHAIMGGIRIYFGDPSTTTVKEQDRVHFADSCAFGAAGQFISVC